MELHGKYVFLAEGVRGSLSKQAIANWRLDAEVSLGLPGEVGIHQFDAFHWFVGGYPTRVRGGGSVPVVGRLASNDMGLPVVF